MVDSTSFFGDETPHDPQNYDGYGRYLLDADGKGQKAYTRATTLAKTTDDGFGLKHWEVRKVAKGVAMSPALVARAAIAPLDDKPTWKEIVAAAEVQSGGDEKRDLGSAFHELHERVPNMTDKEYAAVPHNLRVTYERYRAELDRCGIVEVMTEGTCVNTAIGTAGKFDAIFRLSDGRLVIGDRKSGRVTEYPHAPVQQFAIYANADVLITWDENGAAQRQPMPAVDKEIALVVDITIGDENTASVHIYEADIMAGWYGALLSAKVRRWRNRKDLLTPYQAEFVPPVKVAHLVPVPQEMVSAGQAQPGPIASMPARQSAIIDALWNHPDTQAAVADGQAALDAALAMPSSGVQPERRVVTDASGVEWVAPINATDADIEAAMGVPQPNSVEHAQAAMARREAGTHPAWSSAQGAVIDLNADGTAVEPGGDIPARYESDAASLLAQYKTKAQLQGAARQVDSQMNVGRTRNNLANDIVAHPNWPDLRSALLGDTPEAAGVRVAGDVAQPVPDEVEEVPSFMTAPEPDVAPLTPEDELLQKIGEALTTGPNSDLAAVWEEARQRGIPWSPRLAKAAEIRDKTLKSIS